MTIMVNSWLRQISFMSWVRKFQAFDWLLTLEMEISLVWTSKWNVTKVLYFLTRYLPFIDSSIVMYREFCPGICHLSLSLLIVEFQISLASRFLQMFVGWRTSILPVSCYCLQLINLSLVKTKGNIGMFIIGMACAECEWYLETHLNWNLEMG